MSTQEDDLAVTNDVNYKAPAKKTLEELQKLDAEDESLRKWKESLGVASNGGAAKGGKKVLPLELAMEIADRADVVLNLQDTSKIEEYKKNPIVIKEGIEYKLKIKFQVQNDVVSGLKYLHVVKRNGIKVDKAEEMLGSYGPNPTPYEKKFQPEEAPSGALARGTYNVKSKYILIYLDSLTTIWFLILNSIGVLLLRKTGLARNKNKYRSCLIVCLAYFVKQMIHFLLIALVYSRPGHIQKREVMDDSTIHPKYKRLYERSMSSVEDHLKYLNKRNFEEVGPQPDPRIVKREPKKKKRAVPETEVDFEDPQIRAQFDEYMADFVTGMAHDMFHRLYEDMAGIDKYAKYSNQGPEKPTVKKPIDLNKIDIQLKGMEDQVKERISDRYDDMKDRFVERELKRREMIRNDEL